MRREVGHPLISTGNLLLPGGIAVLAQPRCQMWLLLRFQVDAVVNTLDGLPVGAFCGGDLASIEEFGHLITHAGIAEIAGRSNDVSASKWTASFLNFTPVLANKIPGEFLSVLVLEHARDQLQSILRADVR